MQNYGWWRLLKGTWKTLAGSTLINDDSIEDSLNVPLGGSGAGHGSF